MLRPYELAVSLRTLLDLERRALDGDAQARSEMVTTQGYLRERFRSAPNMQMVLMETVFEHVRVDRAPTMPSRFEAAFCWPTVEMAR